MTIPLLQKQLITLLLLPAVLIAFLMQAGHCQDEHHREVLSSCQHNCQSEHDSNRDAGLSQVIETEHQTPHTPCTHECDLKVKPMLQASISFAVPHFYTEWECPLDLLSLFFNRRDAIKPALLIIEPPKTHFIASIYPLLI